jgi:dihydrofolate reductase
VGPGPPHHQPVFVLTHYARDPIPMEGGTTFHFVTEGIDVALQRAFDAARGLDVRLGGGVATIQDYVRACLVDELHLAISPIILGSGERLLDGLEDMDKSYECSQLVSTDRVRHIDFSRR